MNREEKLLSLLQPKDYVSKIKLFCRDCKFEIKKYSEILAQLKDNQYVCKGIITIQENGKQT